MERPLVTKLLAVFASMLAKALFDYAVSWLKDPANRDDVTAAVRATVDQIGIPTLVDKATDATPWTWDDRLLDGLAQRITTALLPGIVSQIAKALPFGLGGR